MTNEYFDILVKYKFEVSILIGVIANRLFISKWNLNVSILSYYMYFERN